MRIVFALAICLPTASMALDCTPLNPVADKTISKDVQGKIDGEVTGLLSKLGGASAEVDGVYKEIVKGDTLSGYPEGAKLYLWEKIIYFKCELLDDSDFSDKEKNEELDKLMEKILFPPVASCNFPIDPRAAGFTPPKVKNALGKAPAGFKPAGFNLSSLVDSGQTEKAIKYSKLLYEQQSLVYGPYSQETYKAADILAELLRDFGTTGEDGAMLVNLQNNFGSDIGTHGCLAA